MCECGAITTAACVCAPELPDEIMFRSSQPRLCLTGCGLAASPGDVYCDGCRSSDMDAYWRSEREGDADLDAQP
jgi:hypothetical protein